MFLNTIIIRNKYSYIHSFIHSSFIHYCNKYLRNDNRNVPTSNSGFKFLSILSKIVFSTTHYSGCNKLDLSQGEFELSLILFFMEVSTTTALEILSERGVSCIASEDSFLKNVVLCNSN